MVIDLPAPKPQDRTEMNIDRNIATAKKASRDWDKDKVRIHMCSLFLFWNMSEQNACFLDSIQIRLQHILFICLSTFSTKSGRKIYYIDIYIGSFLFFSILEYRGSFLFFSFSLISFQYG